MVGAEQVFDAGVGVACRLASIRSRLQVGCNTGGGVLIAGSILAAAAVQVVRTKAADQQIETVAADECVVASPADELVGRTVATQDVIEVAAFQVLYADIGIAGGFAGIDRPD